MDYELDPDDPGYILDRERQERSKRWYKRVSDLGFSPFPDEDDGKRQWPENELGRLMKEFWWKYDGIQHRYTDEMDRWEQILENAAPVAGGRGQKGQT